MNTEEKKPFEGEETVEVKAPKKVDEPKGNSNSGGKKPLSQNAKIAIIAGVCAILVIALVLVLVLTGGKNGGEQNNGGNNNITQGNGGGGGNPDGNGTTNNKVTYNISLSTKGGMVFADYPVYIYDTDERGEILDYAKTDADGKVSFNLDPNGTYAVVVDFPDGYNANKHYPLVSQNLDIVVESQLLPDNGLVGVNYTIGSIMQDISIVTTTGETITISEILKEKEAVLLNFWFSTCDPCRSEFPIMQEAYQKYQDKLSIIALNPPETQAQDTIETIKQFKSEFGLTFDVAQDNAGLSKAFNVSGYPTSVMIDRYGVVTLLHAGAITSEVVWDQVFAHFTAEDYEQKLVYDYNDIVPKQKPNVNMPTSEEISAVFNDKGLSGVTYLPYRDTASNEEKEYSWPFVIDTVTLDGNDYDVIKTSNANVEGSFCQMIFDLELKAGQVLAFDYYSSTELSNDILYVVVNGKDIYSISGQSEDWKTCYSFVAEEDGVYEIGLVYQKDSSKNEGLDTVFLKNLRVVTESDIDSETYIYRFAATNPNDYGEYLNYVDIYFNDIDGYYHVGSPTGPILLANLMGYTRFSDETTVYELAVALSEEGLLTPEQYEEIVNYCSYASNASIYGVSSVTEDLRDILELLSYYRGDQSNPNDWLRFCCYYDAYGTNGEQLEDPIKGLATFSAFDVIVSDLGATDFPNTFVYDRMIMPRGFIAKFTPSVSGTYLITSNSPDPNNPGYGLETNAWIFTEDGFDNREEWYTYENVSRFNNDLNNCYMMLYFEAGKDYFIDIAFYDVYQEGNVNFRIERLGDEGVFRFSLASPPYFTTIEETGSQMTSWIIHGGINVELGADGIWREKRNDGRDGSIIYADFTMETPIFNHSLSKMIEMGSFNFGLSEEDQYVLKYLEMSGNDPDLCRAKLREIWGEDYDTYAEIYNVESVLAGNTHGDGKDYTDAISKYLDKIIVEGYNEQLDEYIEAGDARIGCVIVTEELSEILQLLMDKYTFMNGVAPNLTSVENSWLKLCYYSQYFCAATPK